MTTRATSQGHGRRLALFLLAAGWCLSALAQLTPRGSSLGSEHPRPLPLDQAFPYLVERTAVDTVTITWQPALDHYLYRHSFEFHLRQRDQVDTLSFTVPDGHATEDEFFGPIEAYYEAVTATVALPPMTPADSQLEIHYQGCAAWGFCYPPQVLRLSLPALESR